MKTGARRDAAADGVHRSPARSVATRGNTLLDAVPRRLRSRLDDLLDPVSLAAGDMLQGAHAIRYVYFPVGCLVSLLVSASGHLPVEAGLVGSEGMIGVSIALGVRSSPLQALVQTSGSALRADAALFQLELQRNPALQRGVNRYIHALIGQLGQTAACNAFHTIEARCARWLLTARDRTHSDEVALTHEFLARRLGVRRVGVTHAAGNLQRRGLITYSRGRVAIVDAKGLAASACECYTVLKDIYTVRSSAAARSE